MRHAADRLRCFNPLPSPKQGETNHEPARRAPHKRVSIRSPHRSKGRAYGARPLSTPPTRSCFNPLPSPKQGETAASRFEARFQTAVHVSIRSPHRSKGRPSTSTAAAASSGFQSAPLTEARGDRLITGRLRGSKTSFNPLPSPKQGETRHCTSKHHPHNSFNPLPSPKQGETRWTRQHHTRCTVSIRSPHRSKGRQVGQPAKAGLVLFQSAPLTEARGDATKKAV